MTGWNWLFPLAALILAPLLPGVINKVKAFFAGRRGPSSFQLYYDLAKLLRKGSVYSHSTTLIFRIAAPLILACTAVALLLLPWGGMSAPVSFAGDFILLLYLLALARFFLVISALDTASAFEGMGASREVLFSAMAEPSLMLGFLVLILHTGSTGLSGIASGIGFNDWQSSAPVLLMIAMAWFFLLLCENSRIPVDDPNTHLELTMIHEVMILDNSGPDLALLEYASSLKLWIFGGLLINLILPFRLDNLIYQILVFIPSMFIVSLLVGITESIMARLKLITIPKVLVGSAALGIVALLVKLVEYYQ
ncbi:MAG TPA: NADH-quinone oxidoreductase subunit H [Candidatus Cloacimonadota bacterium]|nr:NADH-quinone oxidoreductase subunit H [Candidatus Cloacimonadota bacterium]